MVSPLALAMTTAPRPKPYLRDAIDSLRQAGFTQLLHIFAEPTSQDHNGRENIVWHPNRLRLGCFPNWKQSLTYLVNRTQAEWLMVVQDDVIWRTDAAEMVMAAMQSMDPNKVGFLSPYCSAAMAAPDEVVGWHDACHGPGKGFWGALALAFPRRSAMMLLANARFQAHRHHRKVDVVVANVLRDMNLDRLVHVESLADHIGAFSTLGRHRIRGIAKGRRGYNFRPIA